MRKILKNCYKKPDYIGQLIAYLNDFLDKQARNYRQEGFIHAVSGGIDSAVLLKLVVDRFGPKSIICMITYLEDFSSREDLQDAENFCKQLGVDYYYIDITESVKSLTKTLPELKSQPVDNIAARIRIALLGELSVKHNLRLLFAGPYSDFVIRGGDSVGGAVAHCYPFAGLYKSEIYPIARRINVPEVFINKVSSNSSIMKQNPKERMNYGLKFSDVEKLVMFFNGLLPEEKIKHIPMNKRIYFHYLFKIFSKDCDYPCTEVRKPEEFGRKDFFMKFESFPFEKDI